jgi:hypothetical protein
MISVDRNSSALRAAKLALFADQRKFGNLLIATVTIDGPWLQGAAKHPLDRLFGPHAVKRQTLVRYLASTIWIVWWHSLINHVPHSTAHENACHESGQLQSKPDGHPVEFIDMYETVDVNKRDEVFCCVVI